MITGAVAGTDVAKATAPVIKAIVPHPIFIEISCVESPIFAPTLIPISNYFHISNLSCYICKNS